MKERTAGPVLMGSKSQKRYLVEAEKPKTETRMNMLRPVERKQEPVKGELHKISRSDTNESKAKEQNKVPRQNKVAGPNEGVGVLSPKSARRSLEDAFSKSKNVRKK